MPSTGKRTEISTEKRNEGRSDKEIKERAEAEQKRVEDRARARFPRFTETVNYVKSAFASLASRGERMRAADQTIELIESTRFRNYRFSEDPISPSLSGIRQSRKQATAVVERQGWAARNAERVDVIVKIIGAASGVLSALSITAFVYQLVTASTPATERTADDPVDPEMEKLKQLVEEWRSLPDDQFWAYLAESTASDVPLTTHLQLANYIFALSAPSPEWLWRDSTDAQQSKAVQDLLDEFARTGSTSRIYAALAGMTALQGSDVSSASLRPIPRPIAADLARSAFSVITARQLHIRNPLQDAASVSLGGVLVPSGRFRGSPPQQLRYHYVTALTSTSGSLQWDVLVPSSGPYFLDVEYESSAAVSLSLKLGEEKRTVTLAPSPKDSAFPYSTPMTFLTDAVTLTMQTTADWPLFVRRLGVRERDSKR